MLSCEPVSTFRFRPVFDPPVPEARCAFAGETLAACFNTLDELAEANDLVPLTAFADERDIPEEFDETPAELDGLLPEWTEWFDCAEGLEALRALAQCVRTRPGDSRLPDPESVLRELDDLAQALEAARVRGARFRFEIG